MVFYKNTKELNYIFNRKAIKTYIFHRDNIEEEYYWDDYDTTYGYKMNTLANCLIGTKKTTIHSATPSPTKDTETQTKISQPTIIQPTSCLPKPQVEKILLSNTSTQTNYPVCSNSSTQTTNKVRDGTSQTNPKLYLKLPNNPNINIQPFNTHHKQLK